MGAVKINSMEYEDLSDKLYNLTGINLGDSKKSLIESRLNKRLSQLNLQSFKDYLALIEKNPAERAQLIEALTTHKTEWFREPVHFNSLPRRSDFKNKNYFFWSAAASTGEEAYSVAIDLMQKGWSPADFKILGTDISQIVLNVASRGQYSKAQIESDKNFKLISQYLLLNSNNLYEVRPEIQNSIKFRPFNLIDSSKNFGIKFDTIFLRNVLIYFDKESTQKALCNLLKHLSPGGYLVLGLSETIKDLPKGLVSVGHSVYKYER
jgi:chemotaxis protein methyltransferase CheR